MAALNRAHDAGQSCLAFSRDGSSVAQFSSHIRSQSNDPFPDRILYTGGSDLLARVWQADKGPDFEPSIAIEAEGPITCLAASVRLFHPRVFFLSKSCLICLYAATLGR